MLNIYLDPEQHPDQRWSPPEAVGLISWPKVLLKQVSKKKNPCLYGCVTSLFEMYLRFIYLQGALRY